MEFSSSYLAGLALETGFQKNTLEKVVRLTQTLKFINEDMTLKDMLALKGGTAINLTVQKLPRLSVDIDLDLAKYFEKEELTDVKKRVVDVIKRFMSSEDYEIADERGNYALTSLTYRYVNNAGNRDNIKIEINFMDRCHVLPLEKRELTMNFSECPPVLTLNVTELYASKINALLCRATPRDLYDVSSMIDSGIIKDYKMLKKCLVFYNMIGGDGNIGKSDFENIKALKFFDYKRMLKPLLSGKDKFEPEEAKGKVISFLREMDFNNDEMRFVSEFKNKNYMPELLFDDETVLSNIRNHPMALWRCK